jgi:hypothetical protein
MTVAYTSITRGVFFFGARGLGHWFGLFERPTTLNSRYHDLLFWTHYCGRAGIAAWLAAQPHTWLAGMGGAYVYTEHIDGNDEDCITTACEIYSLSYDVSPQFHV